MAEKKNVKFYSVEDYKIRLDAVKVDKAPETPVTDHTIVHTLVDNFGSVVVPERLSQLENDVGFASTEVMNITLAVRLEELKKTVKKNIQETFNQITNTDVTEMQNRLETVEGKLKDIQEIPDETIINNFNFTDSTTKNKISAGMKKTSSINISELLKL